MHKVIFVTVGTHEQPFNRLIEYMDYWAKLHNEKVIMQTGFSTYTPKYAEWKKMYPYQEMIELVKVARIVITHGGPSSFIMPLQIGKIPIVVPRQHKFNEHVNDHQVEFARNVSERMKNILVVEDVQKLGQMITEYDEMIINMKNVSGSHNLEFNQKFEEIVKKL